MGENKAIIFSTHILEEVEAVCSRAIIIDRGRIVANGTPDQLKSRSARAGVVVATISARDADQVKQQCLSVPVIERVEILSAGEGSVTLEAYPRAEAREEGKALAARLAEVAIKEGWRIEGLRTEEGRLEEVFRSITMPDTHSNQGGVR